VCCLDLLVHTLISLFVLRVLLMGLPYGTARVADDSNSRRLGVFGRMCVPILLLHVHAAAATTSGAPCKLGKDSGCGTKGSASVPESACAACDPTLAILGLHIQSKEFYCHPDGTKETQECATAHTAETCCDACMQARQTKGKCDAWFLNKQGGCFFKRCPPEAWKSGECWVDESEANDGFKSGVAPQLCNSTWGVVFLGLFVGVVLLYVGLGVAYNIKVHGHGTKGKRLTKAVLPNVEFWVELYGLLLDGVVFSRTRVAAAVFGRPAPQMRAATQSTAEPLLTAGTSTNAVSEQSDENDAIVE
jgi:hypothetical protein